jgi:hypothetical protein
VGSGWNAEARAAAQGLPVIDLGLLIVQLCADASDRVGSEQEAQWRILGLGDGDDRLGALGRITGLCPVGAVVLLSTQARRGGVVADRGRGLLERAAGEVGAEGSRLDDDDLDSQGSGLQAQRVRDPLDGELGRGVVAGSRRGGAAADRGDVDDRPATPVPHAGQHLFGQVHQAEEVRREQLGDVGRVGFLNRGAVAVAGIVDQHVHAAEPLSRLAGRLDDLVVIAYVQAHGQRGLRMAVDEILNGRDITGGDNRVETPRQGGLGRGAA